MAAYEVQITQNTSVLSNIETFMQDAAYREMIENSATYNTRLCIERKLRMPFLDAQTGVAQNHSNLFMNDRQRMPGLQDGQVFSYPAKRWRKKRRQYLMHFLQPKRKENGDLETGDSHVANSAENTSVILNEDSKDSVGGSSSKDEPVSKDAWYYDDIEMQEIEGYDEPDPDSDYDYEDTYAKKRKRRSTKNSRGGVSDSPMRKGIKGFGRGRRRGINYTPDYSVDSDKPYNCDLCGARYKTRPGLTYHYTHSHKEKASQEDEGSLEGAPGSPSMSRDGKVPPPNVLAMSKENPMGVGPGGGPPMPMNAGPPMHMPPHPDAGQGPGGWGKFQDSYLTFLNAAPGSSNAGAGPGPGPGPGPVPGQGPNTNPKKMSRYPQPQVILPQMSNVSQPHNNGPPGVPGMSSLVPPGANPEDESSSESAGKEDMSKDSSPASVLKVGDEKEKAKPSPYCDFCLGNEESNKKSGQPEELVSCSDCGRSGHPTCLQFTPNMIISVRKYRWQCIECKCCSICGTSDNDDQLLFCDDCDRGYHMYCLAPPLSAPPEGSWSCKLCIEEFHSK
ncbi:zinc finger protein ubi-d4-like isoform X1 [Planococcus citri]|uniref:zinc finger protein ubi-d4-like isoform X1 n=1 Tax=Planococcus citri TaxID=170843 RepID=UPI0031F90173